jgi:hypothetical protein
MIRRLVIIAFFITAGSACCGQGTLLFKKNNHRQAYYKVGDIISFNLKGSKQKISDQIKGFEDSLLVFQFYKINPKEISRLYVDNKTKIWFIFRYKYEKLFLVAGASFLPIEFVNTGKIHQEALLVSGTLLSAGFLAKFLISDKIKIKGRRRLVIIKY